MNLEQLFSKLFAFLRDGLTGRGMTLATLSDTANDPAGEGWLMATADATVVALPAGNPEGSTVELSLLANQIIPVRFKRVYSTGTDTGVSIYIINNGH